MPEERDIGAELYELIRTDFERFLDEESPEFPDQRTANMKQADSYAHTVGQCLARAIAKHVKPEALPDGRLYYNIAEKILDPSLRENHRLVNEFCGEIQELINERQGIHIAPQAAKYPEERAHALINAAAHEEDWNKTERILDDSVRTLTDSFYTDNVKANADLRSKAGLKTYIVREGGSKCCAWCAELVGRYSYPDEVPKDVYRRHDNCTCLVTYVNGRGRQNVWTKAQWTTPAERAERIALAKSKAKPTRFTGEQASALRERVGGLTYGGTGGILNLTRSVEVPETFNFINNAKNNFAKFSDKELSREILEAIEKTIALRTAEKSDFKFDNIFVGRFDDKHKKSVFITDVVERGFSQETTLYLNSSYFVGISKSDFDNMCKQMKDNGWWKSECLEDLLNHEIMHARLGYHSGVYKIQQMEQLLSENKNIKGFCRLVDKQPGEFMNEVFVALKQGETIEKQYLDIYEQYAKNYLGGNTYG